MVDLAVRIGSVRRQVMVPPDGSGVVTFTVSADHPSTRSYEVRVRVNGSGTVVASENIGKPPVTPNSMIMVDMTTLFGTLDAGDYTTSVAAIDDAAVAYDSEESSAFSLPLA